MGLRLRILLVFFLMAGVSTAIVVAGIVIPLVDQYKQANAQLAQSGLQASQLASRYLEARLTESEKRVAWLTAHEDLNYRNHVEATTLFKNLAKQAPGRPTFLAVDAGGRPVASNVAPPKGSLATLPVIQQALKQARPVVSSRFAWPGSHKPAVAIAARFRYYDRQGEHYGVVMEMPDLSAWDTALNPLAGQITVYDAAGAIVVPTSGGTPFASLPDTVHQAKAGTVTTDAGVTAFSRLPEDNWLVVASTPAAQALLPINRDLSRAISLGIMALMVSSVLAFLLSGYIVAPIRRLEAGAAALARGEWEGGDLSRHHLPTDRQDELGRLAASFTAMASQLRGRFEEIEAVVTQRTKELERTNNHLRYAIEELKELDELKRQFLDAVSHELRTPLNFIMGFGSGLEDGLFGDMNEDQEHAVRRIMEGSERLLSVINDLIEVSKLQAGEVNLVPQAIDMAELIGIGVAQMTGAYGALEHQVEVGIEPDLPPAYADPERVGQILRQLLSNAAKFTEAGGKITISAYRKGEHIVTQIADTGCGIPAEHLDHIWDSFRQGDGSMTRTVGGTGVGLTIVKRLIEAMGETIEVESVVDEGTTFRFTLPVADLDNEPSGAPRLQVLQGGKST